MSTNVLNSDRNFQIWKYTVGHRQLLLRSTKTPDLSTRIDVFFKGVRELHLPVSLDGLSITESSEEELRSQCLLKSPTYGNDTKVFRLQGSNYLGYVAALVVVYHEDYGEYDDPSFFAKNNIL